MAYGDLNDREKCLRKVFKLKKDNLISMSDINVGMRTVKIGKSKELLTFSNFLELDKKSILSVINN